MRHWKNPFGYQFGFQHTLIRKRKREVLEEEQDISDGECEKFKKSFDGLPDDFVLPEDTTGAGRMLLILIL